jgi:hypothetical protein
LANDDLKKRVLARFHGDVLWDQASTESVVQASAPEPQGIPKTAALRKAAGFPPFPPKEPGGGGGGPPPGLEGKGSISTKRNIPKDHPYDPKALKPMAKALWAASVALGHALTAYRHFSRLKSATISPDGMLGGRGFVMPMPDMRKRLHEACDSLSALTDTLHDEINAPHWKSKLSQLDENEVGDIEHFVEESQSILENPEEDAEEDSKDIEESNDDEDEKKGDDIPLGDKSEGSKLPGGGGLTEALSQNDAASEPKTQSPSQKEARRSKAANSSLPVETMPGGPRVEHLDREDGPPEGDPPVSDDWGLPSERGYDYESPWDNNLNEKGAQSAVPDHVTEDTPTEAWDFGLGFGARGEGAGGYANPSGEGDGTKGVYGPASELPGNTPSSSGDNTFLKTDLELNDKKSQGELPGDGDEPVARSDYYRGDRGNLINTQSVLPNEPTPGGELAPSMMNTDYTHEDLSTPYVRYDYTTHDYRDDPLHEFPQNHQAGTTNV